MRVRPATARVRRLEHRDIDRRLCPAPAGLRFAAEQDDDAELGEVELLEFIGRLRLQRGDVAGALEMAERSHALDASNERAIQLAMEADATLGRREAVVARYEQLRRDLDERFGLEPSHETKMLYRSILSQDSGERVENERRALG